MKRLHRLLCLAVFWMASGTVAADPLPVFVTILPLQYFVERVGGPEVEVSVMVGPGQSPATYEPTPRQMASLARSPVLFGVGIHFETVWVPRLKDQQPGLAVVDLSQGLPLRHIEAHGHGDEGHGEHGHGEPGGGFKDPHVWTDPNLVRTMAVHIRDTLAALRPEARARFDENLARFDADLATLDREIRATLSGLSSRRFLVFHPSWGYFADAYGLTQVAVEVGGKEPGARTLAGIIDRARAEGVRAVFVQRQFSTRAAAAVASAIGTPVVEVDPLSADYLNNLRQVASRFAEALR